MTVPPDQDSSGSIDGVHATITLQKPQAGRVGADRIALLRAIRRGGSISQAARDIGLSYKSAWDAVQILNNLFDRPLVLPSAGGKDGGTSLITPAGEIVLDAYDAAEAELAGTMARLETELAHGLSLKPLLWGIAMKTSARNTLRGTVTRVTPGAVNAEIVLEIAPGVEIVAIITRESAIDLDLAPGKIALALIKSSFVILAQGDASLRTSARNTLAGIVVRREDGPVSSEIVLEMSEGKTLTATVTRESAETLDLRIGSPALALIKASHVILAIE
ncbi:MAG: TOBE domain-containing protein [Pseudomonadota bacterium]